MLPLRFRLPLSACLFAVAALAAAGLVVPTADAAAIAETDVIISSDGRARAVRLVSVSSPTLRRMNP